MQNIIINYSLKWYIFYSNCKKYKNEYYDYLTNLIFIFRQVHLHYHHHLPNLHHRHLHHLHQHQIQILNHHPYFHQKTFDWLFCIHCNSFLIFFIKNIKIMNF